MSKALSLYVWSLWLNIGWFPGDPFKAFCLTFGETDHGYSGDIDFVTLLSIQVIYFTFGLGWRKRY